ncbi:flagellar biosynthesis protein FlhF [Chitinimonas lacunae]|uniref:Flagellar biosynthesis protein FlhF n=1 Tax=Chitinimonas lacunae TaxID=1963018 RepID=A0ABV8MML5_9NEIS
MMVKKFHGASTRDVLKQVRDELGPDALILSNRQLPNGSIEIMAVADTDMAALTDNRPAPVPAPRPVIRAEPPRPASPPPAAPPSFSKVLQRTYALPPELSDDDELGPAELPPLRPSQPPVTARIEPRAPVEPPRPEPVLAPRQRPEPIFDEPPPPPPSQLRVEPTLTVPLEAAPPRPHAPRPLEPVAAMPQPTVQPVAAAEPHGRVEPKLEPKLEGISHDIEDISQEIRMLRSLLEGQLAGLAWNELKRQDPERLEVLRRLLSVGFSPALSRQIVEHMPANYSTERGMKWARTALQHNLPTVGPGADIIEAGGVYALVGPTGVGKTTTVAKLAARATLKHGAAKVALVTTDGYRIGAQDQLRIYGKILGVPVYAVTDEKDLHQTLADLRNRHLVLLDTVGMGQRDQRVAEQIALLSTHAQPVRRLLLLSANAQGTTLDDVVRRYHGGGLTGCIFTKIDEAFSLGAGLDVIVRYKLPLYYITNGQRVPEDLHIASSLYLIDRVFKTPPEAPAYRLKSEEYPLFLGARVEPTLDFSWREQN